MFLVAATTSWKPCRNLMTQIGQAQSMIPKSVKRFSEKIMLQFQVLPPPGGRVILNTVSTTAYSS